MLKIFRSYRFAAYQISGLLIATFLVAILILLRIDFTNLWVSLTILTVLIISVTTSLTHRISTEVRRSRSLITGSKIFSKRRTILSKNNSDDLIEKIRASNKPGYWKCSKSADGYYLLLRSGSLGLLGSYLFHFALLVISAAIIINLLFGFNGMFALTEGETFNPQTSTFKLESTGPFFQESSLAEYKFKLSDYNRNYDLGEYKTPAAVMTLSTKNDTVENLIYKNFIMKFDGFNMSVSKKWGYAPGLFIKDSEGNQLFNGFIRIATRYIDNEQIYADSFWVEESNVIYLSLDLNPYKKTQTVFVKESEVINPVLSIMSTPEGGSAPGIKLHRNQEKKLNTTTFAFTGLRQWTQFELGYSPGVPLLYLGFLLSVIGLAARLMFSRKTIAILLKECNEGTEITITGTAEKYSSQLEMELNGLQETLKKI